MLNIVLNKYKAELIKRYDESPAIIYLNYTDFKGLKAESFEFFGNKEQKMRGAFYFYGDKNSSRFIIFDHGIGGGHHSYMREIEKLASNGYTVLAYDHTGCADSEGESIFGISQSIADLSCLIDSLRKTDEYRTSEISLMGHSWGGLAVLNIANIYPDIKRIVSISAPLSVKALVEGFMTGVSKMFIPAILKFEREQNGEIVDFNAIEALLKTDARVLLIHSEDDSLVPVSNFEEAEEKLKERKNTEFIKVSGKAHNPNYTQDAVKYMGEFFAAFGEKTKNKELLTEEEQTAFRDGWDVWKMTEQDDGVWYAIFEFLNGTKE